MNDLRARIASAVILAVLVLGSTLVGGWLFAIICTLIAMIVWAEWFDVVSPNGDDRVRLLGFFFLGLLFVAGLIVANGTMPYVWALATIVFAAASVSMAGGKWAVAGFVYSGLALVALNMLRHSETNASGLVAILFLFAVVWATDIGAYFAGRHFGGPKIAPAISPKKTWSGGFGGVGSAIVAGLLVFFFAGREAYGLAVGLAIVLSVISQAGDFFESWIKRRNGVKDSSHIIPGHGGFMDRVDGLVFAAIALWALGVLEGGFSRPADAFF